jgi:hypothetical protein
MATLMGATKLSSIVNVKPGNILLESKGTYIPFMDCETGRSSDNRGSAGGQILMRIF